MDWRTAKIGGCHTSNRIHSRMSNYTVALARKNHDNNLIQTNHVSERRGTRPETGEKSLVTTHSGGTTVFFRVLNFLQKIHYVDFHHLFTVFTHFFYVIHYPEEFQNVYKSYY